MIWKEIGLFVELSQCESKRKKE